MNAIWVIEDHRRLRDTVREALELRAMRETF